MPRRNGPTASPTTGPNKGKQSRKTMVCDPGTVDNLKILFHEVQANSAVETMAYAVRFAALPENRDALLTYMTTHHWDGTSLKSIRAKMLGAKGSGHAALAARRKAATEAEMEAEREEREAHREEFLNARIEVITAIIDRTDFTEDN